MTNFFRGISYLALLLTFSGCAQAVAVAPESSRTVATATATATAKMEELLTQTDMSVMTVTPTATPISTPTALVETSQPIASILASDTPTPAPSLSHTTKPSSKLTPKPTPKPTKKVSATPTPELTATPNHISTQEPSEVSAMSSAYKNAVLRGINYARSHNGEYSADPVEHLDSSLSAKAQKHAEEMAAKGDIFHSNWGPESVSCGNLGNGENAGVQSAVHAAGLLDAEITRIGVGAAKSADGTIYLCVDGGK